MSEALSRGWQTRSLNEIAKIKGGKRIPKGEKLVFENTGFPYIRVADFNDNGTIDLGDIRYITETVFDQIKNYTIDSSDLYISIAGTIGKTGIVPQALSGASLTENACKLVFDSSISNQYVYYFTQTLYFLDQAGLNTRVTAMPKLALSRLGTIKIPVPLLVEQKRIVAILDQAFADIEQARAKTEQNLKNSRELFESYLQQVFSRRGEGWESKKVSEIADTCLGKMLDKKKNKGIPKPYLRNLNVQWFDVRTDDLLEMRFEDSEYERYAIKKGDLVLCEGGYPGRGAIWNNDEDIFFQKALHRVRCHNVSYNRWVLYYLFLSDCDGSLKSHFTGAGIQHFTGKALKQLSLPVPPEDVAKQYLEKIDGLHSEVTLLEAVYEKKLYQLDELKKSILQKAFSGELTKDSKGVAA